jgi:carboxypeptidase T
MRKALLLFLVFAGITTCAIAQNKLSKVKIKIPESKYELSEIIGLLQIDHYHPDDGFLYTEIGEQELAKLKKSKLQYEILVEDVGKHLQELNNAFYAARAAGQTDPEINRAAFEQTCKGVNTIIATPAAFEVKATFGGYYSYAEMVTAIDNLVAAYPGLAQKIALSPNTIEGRTIFAVKISDNVTTNETTEPDVLYMGLQHAREAIGGSSMIFLMQYLCENYAGDSKIKSLVDNREFYIIPCMNPDGWEFNRTTTGVGGAQRKNRRNNTAVSADRGVDLNRNWSINWGNCGAPIQGSPTSCGSNTVTDDTYYGTAAFSEPETQAVRNLITSRNIVAGIDQHAFGPYYSLPFGRASLNKFSTTPGVTVLDSIFYDKTAALMGKYNGMRAADSYQALAYEVAGGFKDWMLLGDIGTGSKVKAYGLTGEGGAGGGTGGAMSNFWAPAAQITNLCKGMTYQNLQLALVAGAYVDIQDASDISLTALTGNLSFNLRRLGLQTADAIVSLIPLQNISSVGAPVTVSTLAALNSTATGNISYTLPAALGNGQQVRFAWKVETGGQTYYDTITKFYNPVQLFYDDMEGALVTTNWTVSAGWNYTTTSAFQGTKSLTESPSGDYSASQTLTAQYRNTFNLSDATAAYISFWTRHRSENFQDKLQVEVSTNGTTWVPICGKTTVQEPGTLDGSTLNGQPSLTGIQEYWSREQFDLSAYLGTAALRLRFDFTSDAGASGYLEIEDGFYIDNLKVIKSTSTLVTLPTKFENFFGKLTADSKVQLDWEVFMNEQHDYFEVEKSKDGAQFNAIARVNGYPPYQTMDANPFTGNNYYRIKQYDKNGTITYSKVINVVLNPGGVNLVIYPNPVSNELRVRINTMQMEPITVQVNDMQGRLVYEKQYNENGLYTEIKVNTAAYAPGVYAIKILNNQKQLLTTQKFIKQ